MEIGDALKKAWKFARTGVWYIHLSKLSRPRAILLRWLRIFLLALRGFNDDKCPLRASALTFYSLLSVVPIAAMLFGIAKGFGFRQRLETQLLEQFPEHQEVALKIIEYSKSFLESARGGLVAGIGIILLFWIVVRVLGNIEQSFNDIWKIRQSRNFLRKFTDYLAIMLIGPINLIISSSATVLITAEVTELGEKFGLSGVVEPLVTLGLRVLPLLLIWILFAFIYIVMPNTRVHWKSGIVAAVIAGSVYQITQLIFVKFQLGVANYNAIYGSFAALPLFLIWLQLSWFIVLFGAEISYAVQYVDNYEFAPLVKTLSPVRKKLLSLYIVHLSVKVFAEGKNPLISSEISTKLGIPIVIVRDTLFTLVGAKLLSETYSEINKEIAYQPASDINRYTVSYVLKQLDEAGSNELPVAPNEQLDELSATLINFEQLVHSSPANKLLSDI